MPLDRILELRNQPPEPTRLAILRELAQRLDAGEISGDLNPENIFISGDLSGTNVVVALKDTNSRFVPEEELAADGRIPEAARYLSPERILGTSTDIRSHEFSLAVIAYEFVCGKKPFDAPDLRQLFYRVCTEKHIPAEEVHPKLSGRISGVLSRALAKDRERRFPNCQSFVQALIAALRNEAEPAVSSFSRERRSIGCDNRSFYDALAATVQRGRARSCACAVSYREVRVDCGSVSGGPGIGAFLFALQTGT